MNTQIVPLTQKQSGLSREHFRMLKKLSSPQKIQDFLDRFPFNFEEKGETYRSPQFALVERKMHCFEGALLGALALWIHGERPLLLDLKTDKKDIDHVVVLFMREGCWGALSKTNHAVLRYREPVYKSVRELSMSYFHEYFLPSGQKTLRSYSKPFDLSKKGTSWIISEENLYDLMYALDDSPHVDILTRKQIRTLRKADPIERTSGEIIEWKSK